MPLYQMHLQIVRYNCECDEYLNWLVKITSFLPPARSYAWRVLRRTLLMMHCSSLLVLAAAIVVLIRSDYASSSGTNS